jgi:hypothetical protein
MVRPPYCIGRTAWDSDLFRCHHLVGLSAALLIDLWPQTPWLVSTRLDGKDG